MMNRDMRGATAALAIAALCNPLLGLPCSTTAFAAQTPDGIGAAMLAPAVRQIDAFGYASPAPTYDTGSLIASSPLIHAVPQDSEASSEAPATAPAAPNAAEVSW